MLSMFGNFVKLGAGNVAVRQTASQLGQRLVHTSAENSKLHEKYPNKLTDEALIALEEARAATPYAHSDKPVSGGVKVDAAILKHYPNELSKETLDEGLKQTATMRKKSSVY